MTLDKPCESISRIAFETTRQALMVKQCLEVDEELQPLKIERSYELEDNILIVYVFYFKICRLIDIKLKFSLIWLLFRHYKATEIKLLRVAMSSFFDMVIVCTKTMLEFDQQP